MVDEGVACLAEAIILGCSKLVPVKPDLYPWQRDSMC